MALATGKDNSLKQYLGLLDHILTHGEERQDRTGTVTLSCFGYQLRFDLGEGFPVVTTKKLHLRSIIHELLWFLKGETNIEYLNQNGVSIWDEWADENGELGPIYGYQWRNWGGEWDPKKPLKERRPGIDQISNVIQSIQKNPHSRRHIVSAWNVPDVEKLDPAPPFCHTMFQFYVSNDRRLSCHLYQRSADTFLGVPFNISSYALLTMMMAQVTDLKPGHFVHSFGDVHLYKNHIEQANLQLTREPRHLPEMKINPAVRDIFEFKFDDFSLENYDPHPHIKAEISI